MIIISTILTFLHIHQQTFLLQLAYFQPGDVAIGNMAMGSAVWQRRIEKGVANVS